MTSDYDFDTTGYFQAAAVTLIRRHGEDALLLADHALRRVRAKGDDEGIFLWAGVRSAIFETIVDGLSDRPALQCSANAGKSSLYH